MAVCWMKLKNSPLSFNRKSQICFYASFSD